MGQIKAQDKSSRAPRSEVFRDWKFKMVDVMVDEDSHSTDLSVSGEEAGLFKKFYRLITFFGFKWEQSYLATLVTSQNCTKMLRNLTFVVQFTYFSIRPKKVFVFSSNFWATFVTKSNFWLFFEQHLSNFLRNNGKLFGESRATCGKPVGSVVHSFNYSFTHSFILSFIHSFIHSFVRSFVR